MKDLNWFAIILVFALPIAVIIGMIVEIVKNHRKAKRRAKRHREIEEWWKMEVKK